VLTLITSPAVLTSGPAELPGLIAAQFVLHREWIHRATINWIIEPKTR
jgi:hypothetical protein